MLKTDITKEKALVKADIYRLLSLAFTFPDKDMMEFLHALATDIEEVVKLPPYDIKDEFFVFQKPFEGLDIEALKPEYTELFLTRMICPPYETSYGRNNFNRPNIIADISGFYRAFGFSLSENAGVMHDNIAVEFEFMGLLSLKEAYAIEKGMEENLDISLSAEKKFLSEHLGVWVGLFCKNLGNRTTKDYYRSLSVMIERFMDCELRSHGIVIDIEGISELPKEDGTMTCPMDLKAGNVEESSFK